MCRSTTRLPAVPRAALRTVITACARSGFVWLLSASWSVHGLPGVAVPMQQERGLTLVAVRIGRDVRGSSNCPCVAGRDRGDVGQVGFPLFDTTGQPRL